MKQSVIQMIDQSMKLFFFLLIYDAGLQAMFSLLQLLLLAKGKHTYAG